MDTALRRGLLVLVPALLAACASTPFGCNSVSDGASAMARGNLELARNCFDGYVAHHGDDPPSRVAFAHLQRARVHYLGCELPEAVTDATEAAKLDNDTAADAFELRGSANLALKNYEGAVHDFRSELSRQPDLATAQIGLGWASLASGDLKSAYEAFDKALKLQSAGMASYSDRRQANERWSLLTAFAGREDQGERSVPGEFVAYLGRSDVQRRLGRDWAAEADLLLALGMAPKSAKTLNALAWLKAMSHDPGVRDTAAAERYATTACELTGYKHAPYLDTLAATQAAAGHYDKAVETARRSLSLAEAAGTRPELSAPLKKRLASYEAREPYAPLSEESAPEEYLCGTKK